MIRTEMSGYALVSRSKKSKVEVYMISPDGIEVFAGYLDGSSPYDYPSNVIDLVRTHYNSVAAS